MQTARTVALLSPLERSILGALQHSGGTSTTMGLMARLYPHLAAERCLTEVKIQLGLAKALEIIKSLSELDKRGLVHQQGVGRYCITLVGMARIAQAEKRAYNFGSVSRNMFLALGTALALSACSIFVIPTPEQNLVPTYTAQPIPKTYELQQFRESNGVLGFRLCSNDCQAPTPKTVAVIASTENAPSLVEQPTVKQIQAPQQISSRVLPSETKTSKATIQAVQHYRLYFRFGASEFGPEAMAAIKAAIPDLRKMARIEISAGTDPIGSADQNSKQIALRQVAVKSFLITAGIKPDAIVLVQNQILNHDLTIKGMPPRSTQHAEMRQANLVGFR